MQIVVKINFSPCSFQRQEEEEEEEEEEEVWNETAALFMSFASFR